MRNTIIIFFGMILANLQMVDAQESVISGIEYAKLEQYISLAKQNFPRKKIFEANEAKAKSGIPLAKVSYLDPLTASYIYRPNEKESVNALNPYQINGFQFTVSVNVGSFLKTPYQVKQAKQEYEVAKLENKEYEAALVNEVKSRYYVYLQFKNDLTYKTQVAQDSKIIMDDWQKKFERAEAEIKDYNESKTSYSAAMSGQLEVEVNYLKAKDALEEIIGMPLDSVK